MQQNYCIILNGYPRAGKDTFADLLLMQAKYYEWNTLKFSSADDAKLIAKNIFNWNGEKNDKWRNRLSMLVDFLDMNYDASYVSLNNIFQNFKQKNNHSLVTVMFREPAKIDKAKKLCKSEGIQCITVFISNEIARTAIINNKNICHSDRNVECYDYDYYIDNNGSVTDLSERVIAFFKQLSNPNGRPQ